MSKHFLSPLVAVFCLALFCFSPAADAATTLYCVTTDGVVEVDIATGNRTMISSNSVGSGAAWNLTSITRRLRCIVQETETTVIVGLDGGSTGNQELYRVDITNGARTVLSNSSVGSGPDLFFLKDLTLGPGNTTVWAVCSDNVSNYSIYSVDLATGDRTFITSGFSGSGVSLANARALRFEDPDNIIVTRKDGLIARVDISGPVTRTSISDFFTGSGPNLTRVNGLVINSSGDLLVSQYAESVAAPFLVGQVLSVDPTSGDRTEISGVFTGTGTDILVAWQMDDDETGQLFICDLADSFEVSGGNGAIFQVDPGTGNRTVISGLGTGTGPTLGDGSTVRGPYDVIVYKVPPSSVDEWTRY